MCMPKLEAAEPLNKDHVMAATGSPLHIFVDLFAECQIKLFTEKRKLFQQFTYMAKHKSNDI